MLQRFFRITIWETRCWNYICSMKPLNLFFSWVSGISASMPKKIPFRAFVLSRFRPFRALTTPPVSPASPLSPAFALSPLRAFVPSPFRPFAPSCLHPFPLLDACQHLFRKKNFCFFLPRIYSEENISTFSFPAFVPKKTFRLFSSPHLFRRKHFDFFFPRICSERKIFTDIPNNNKLNHKFKPD